MSFYKKSILKIFLLLISCNLGLLAQNFEAGTGEVINPTGISPAKRFTEPSWDSDYWQKIRTERIESDSSVNWKQFGPGMAGYNEGFWCHPTDTNVMFIGPDMHISYGTWDNGKSWHTLKDPDGLGQEMKRVLDVEFSEQNPDFGMALDWNGWLYKTMDRGHSWKMLKQMGKSYSDLGIDPNYFRNWYFEQLATRHSELAVDPTNDNVWFVGAGDFWNVKGNHKSLARPNGNILPYASYGYVWKTTDKGASWQKITSGLPETTDVARIIVNPTHPDSIIMATNHGLYISGDAGISWEISPATGLPHNLPRDLTSYYDSKSGEFILFLIEQTVFEDKGNTVSANGGIFKSTDGGINWTSITGNLAIDLSRIDCVPEQERFHRAVAHWFGISRDDSKLKFTVYPETTYSVFNRIVVNPLDKNEIYISHNKKHDRAFGPGDVWKTSDGGQTWTACARNGQYWINGNNNGYWQERGNPTGANLKYAHLQPFQDREWERQGTRHLTMNSIGQVYIGIDQQTFKSNDHGISWQQMDDFETAPGSKKWVGRGGSNLPGRFMLLETGIEERKLLCSGEHGLWQTTDPGDYPDMEAVAVEQLEGQVNKHGAVSISTVAVHPHNPDIIYILMWRQEQRGKLRRSTDGGKTWENIASIFDPGSVPAQNSLIIDPVNPDNMYFCTTYKMISEIGFGLGRELSKGGYGFYRSTDGGYTWELSNNGFHKGASVRRIVIHPDNPEIIFAALNDDKGGLFKSSNKGSNWSRMSIPPVIKAVNNVFIDRNNKQIYICAGRRTGTYEEGGVWRSSDKGNTWEQIFKAPYVWQAETSPVNPDLIIISVPGQAVDMVQDFMNPGIYLSGDAGKNWIKINNNLGHSDKMVDVKPDPYDERILWGAAWGSGWYKGVIKTGKE